MHFNGMKIMNLQHSCHNPATFDNPFSNNIPVALQHSIKRKIAAMKIRLLPLPFRGLSLCNVILTELPPYTQTKGSSFRLPIFSFIHTAKLFPTPGLNRFCNLIMYSIKM
jgi:hypothetical protein